MSRFLGTPEQEVLRLWLRITQRTLTREQSEMFVLHPELPKIIRSLQLTGPDHVEQTGRARVANGTLRLVDWRVGLSTWAAERYNTRIAAEEERMAAEEELATIEARISDRKAAIGYFDEFNDDVEPMADDFDQPQGLRCPVCLDVGCDDQDT